MQPVPDIGRFSGTLRAWVARRVNAAHVDDIVGEILVRVATHGDQFNAADNPLAWLHTVARNLVIDHYRRQAAETSALQQLEQEAFDREETTGDDSYRELAPCLLPMIDALPEPYREALRLTDIEGLTQAEAAAQKGLSVSGMKSRVQRGREKLKAALLRCCDIEINRQGRIVGHTPRSNNPTCGSSCD